LVIGAPPAATRLRLGEADLGNRLDGRAVLGSTIVECVIQRPDAEPRRKGPSKSRSAITWGAANRALTSASRQTPSVGRACGESGLVLDRRGATKTRGEAAHHRGHPPGRGGMPFHQRRRGIRRAGQGPFSSSWGRHPGITPRRSPRWASSISSLPIGRCRIRSADGRLHSSARTAHHPGPAIGFLECFFLGPTFPEPRSSNLSLKKNPACGGTTTKGTVGRANCCRRTQPDPAFREFRTEASRWTARHLWCALLGRRTDSSGFDNNG